MNPDTQAIRDRLLAALRNAPVPLTTKEACDAAGPYHALIRGRYDAAGCERFHRHVGHQLVACQPDGHVVSVSLYATNRGYVNLRALETQGLVLRHSTPGMRVVAWSAVGSHTHAELAMLEEMWAR